MSNTNRTAGTLTLSHVVDRAGRRDVIEVLEGTYTEDRYGCVSFESADGRVTYASHTSGDWARNGRILGDASRVSVR